MQNRIASAEVLRVQCEVDQLVENMEAVDLALGSHLLHDLITEGGFASVPLTWWRNRILTWCARPSTRRAFGREVAVSTAIALRELDDHVLASLVHDLLRVAASAHAAMAAAGRRPRR